MIRAMDPAAPVPVVSLLSIDAWRESGGGWTWNNWYCIAQVPLTVADMKPRALLQYLRERGTLSQYSRGRVAVEDDGYNIVILAKGTREPLYAIAYGEADLAGNAMLPAPVTP